ncbi:MAG TPA: hypothetical protein VN520_05320 [Streptomyces sp.]|uniref:hypothetical protein n=1 Tax=Streptomyces sp. TaxID=1931 RepID=UPI002C2ABB59|nr:hypothetical protein [Streptomyces sp.]HWU05805.1 hypothetical protein [Streptomyces sp.]
MTRHMDQAAAGGGRAGLAVGSRPRRQGGDPTAPAARRTGHGGRGVPRVLFLPGRGRPAARLSAQFMP